MEGEKFKELFYVTLIGDVGRGSKEFFYVTLLTLEIHEMEGEEASGSSMSLC